MHVPRPMVLLGAGLLGLAALAGGVALTQALRAERVLAGELDLARSAGLLPLDDEADVAPELAQARARLEDLLARVQQSDTLEGGLAFGGPGMLWSDDPDVLARLARGLDERAQLVQDIEALPLVLWESPAQPTDPIAFVFGPRRTTDSLAALRSATNLMCAVDWKHAREPSGSAEAGRWLARALALARVTDGGETVELLIANALEVIALDCLEGLRQEGIVDAEALEAPLRAELERTGGAARWRAALRLDIARIELMHGMGSAFELAWSRDRLLHEEVRWRRELLERGLPGAWRELARIEFHPAVGERWVLGVLARALEMRDGRRARVLGNG